MALYHLSARIIGRSSGRSVVAASAWQNACTLYDHRLGVRSNFNGKRIVAYSAILLPDGAPKWLSDREALWNAIETIEKRKDAQLARQFDVALPDELSLAARIAALEAFSHLMTDNGFVADATLVEIKREGASMRHHGYVLMTTRPFIGGVFVNKNPVWNSRAKLNEVRVAWANILNAALDAEGSKARVDHRSNEARGLAEPSKHIGVIALQMARRGEQPDRLRNDEPS